MINDIINLNNKANNVIVTKTHRQKSFLIKQKSKQEKLENKVFNLKIMTQDDLIEKLSFSIDHELKLVEIKKGVPISIINEMFRFSHYMIDDQRFEHYLSYLTKTDSLIQWIKKQAIYFFEEPVFLKKWLDLYQLKYKIINFNEEKQPVIYAFDHQKEELIYLFESIATLLNEGFDSNKIYIANASKEHQMKMMHLARSYEIPVDLNLKQPLFDYPYTKKLLSQDYVTFSVSIAKKTKTDLEDQIEQQLIDLINQYDIESYSWEDIIELVKHESKTTYLKQPELSNAVRLIDVEDIKLLESDDKCFMINATYGSFPSLKKDNEWLSDCEKKTYDYPTSQMINEQTTAIYDQMMKQSQVTYISYALEDTYQTYTPSDLVSKHQDQVIHKKLCIDDLTHSFAPDIYKSYFKNRSDQEILTTYSNQFNPSADDLKQIKSYINEKDLKLSPTHLINYIKSPFIYYVNHILGISDFETNPSINVGNFFHALVEVIYMITFRDKVKHSEIKDKSQYDEFIKSHHADDEIKKMFDDFMEIYFKDYKAHVSNLKIYSKTVEIDTLDVELLETLFYVDKYKNHMIHVIDQLIAYEQSTPADEYLIELMVLYDQFKGKADLVRLTHINDKTYYSVVDYKSSDKAAFSLEGIDTLIEDLNHQNSIDVTRLPLIQLLFYAQLLFKSNAYHFSDLAFLNFLNNDLKFNGLYNGQILRDQFYWTKSKSGTTRSTYQETLNPILIQIEDIANSVLNKINQALFDNYIIEGKNRKDRSLIQQYDGYKAIHFLFDYQDEEEEDES